MQVYEIGDRVHYKFYGNGVIRERVETERGVKYRIEFAQFSAWMEPNELLRRVNQTAASDIQHNKR